MKLLKPLSSDEFQGAAELSPILERATKHLVSIS